MTCHIMAHHMSVDGPRFLLVHLVARTVYAHTRLKKGYLLKLIKLGKPNLTKMSPNLPLRSRHN